ncbi:MAG TPA: Crp/Fnr family transcriptional regulator, partial [Gammaproteobacteria bacterium]|nr:Crp/Fnr family transcriptional regulator [Gammaproteobacteria bacterium]
MTDLSHISIFEGLPEAELSALQELCITRTYPKNTVTISEGDQANAMFIC